MSRMREEARYLPSDGPAALWHAHLAYPFLTSLVLSQTSRHG